MNEVVRNLTLHNFEMIKASYDTSRRIFWDQTKQQLVHPGEYGAFRERLLRQWLAMYVPKRFGISSGFLINVAGAISTQCDVIIYDRETTPTIQSADEQLFFPIETVVAVGEIKSDINSPAQLNDHLLKLSKIKKLRDDMSHTRPYRRVGGGKFDIGKYPFDNVFTFLICNKIAFGITKESVSYNADRQYQHNRVLSLKDGVISWVNEKGTNLPYSFLDDENYEVNLAQIAQDDPVPGLTVFLSALDMAVDMVTLLNIDLSCYLSDAHREP